MVLQDNLGRDEPACIEAVKKLYRDLGLEKVYADYEEKTFKEIQEKIRDNAHHVPTVAFDLALALTHKRSK